MRKGGAIAVSSKSPEDFKDLYGRRNRSSWTKVIEESGVRARVSSWRDMETGDERGNRVEVAVIGTGWCGGIRAEKLSRSSIVDKLHICEFRPDRLAEVKKLTTRQPRHPTIATSSRTTGSRWSTSRRRRNPTTIRSRAIASRPASTVLLEKPIAHRLFEADELNRDRQARQSQIHHRLFAALQHQARLRQKRSRRHAGQAGVGDGEPASLAQPRPEDRKPRPAVAGDDGIDPRPSISCSGCSSRPGPSASIRQGAYGYMQASTAPI